MKTVRFGIIGAGSIANKFAAAAKNAQGCTLLAIASRKMESAAAFAEKHDIPLAYGSYEELLSSGEVDAVYIALPHNYHVAYAKQALLAGKHVLCEKPLAINAREAEELIAVQKKTGLFAMEAVWTRFLPAMQKVKELILAGTIGEVREVSADFCYYTSGKKDRIFDNAMGGGALLDVGIYGLTFASMFLGDEVKDIKALACMEGGVDEQIHVLLGYEGGRIARISSAIRLQKPGDAYIYGTEGTIHIPNFWGAYSYELYTMKDKVTEKVACAPKGNGFEEEIEACCDCILRGQAQNEIMPLSLSLKMTALMDKIRGQIGLSYPADFSDGQS